MISLKTITITKFQHSLCAEAQLEVGGVVLAYPDADEVDVHGRFECHHRACSPDELPSLYVVIIPQGPDVINRSAKIYRGIQRHLFLVEIMDAVADLRGDEVQVFAAVLVLILHRYHLVMLVHGPRDINVQRIVFVEIMVVLQVHTARQDRLPLKERAKVVKFAEHPVFPEVCKPDDGEHPIRYAQFMFWVFAVILVEVDGVILVQRVVHDEGVIDYLVFGHVEGVAVLRGERERESEKKEKEEYVSIRHN